MKRFVLIAAIDFSTSGDAAALEALELASAHPRAEVHFIAVQETTLELLAAPHEEIRSPVEPLRDLVREAVHRFEATHAISSIERVTVHSMIGEPASSIVAFAGEHDADLIVVGTHGRCGIKRAVLGSVAEKVVRTAGCPVFVTREKAHVEALKEPEVEPPCRDCAAARRTSSDQELWCAHHAKLHVEADVFGHDDHGAHLSRPVGSSA